MSDLVLRDKTTDHDRGTEHVPQTRALTIDLETPWTLHALFRSEAYVSHTAGNALVDVALAANGGYACATIGPTDGIQDRSFDNFFSGGERHPADKTSITFRSDVHDADTVIPAVLEALKSVQEIRQDK